MITCLCVRARVCLWYATWAKCGKTWPRFLHSDVTNTSKTNKVRHRIIPSCVTLDVASAVHEILPLAHGT